MKKIITLALFILPALSEAAVFSNGAFSEGDNNWHAVGLVQITDQAVLQTANGYDDAFALNSVLVQGDDGSFWNGSSVQPFTLGFDSRWLYFDAKFEDLAADINETSASVFSDALFVSLYDYNGISSDLSFEPIIDISKNGLGFQTYKFDISALQGHEIALSFELFDEDDGRDSRVTIDNVQFASAVPIPSAVFLFASAIPLFGWRRLKSVWA